jgi:hypothetical protein
MLEGTTQCLYQVGLLRNFLEILQNLEFTYDSKIPTVITETLIV